MSRPFGQVGVTQRLRSVLKSLAHRLSTTEDGAPAVVVGLGIGYLLIAVWNFRRETRQFGIGPGPVIAASLVGVVGLLVCFVGAWLWRSDFSAEERWVVAAGTLVGSILGWGVIYISILARVLEGRAVAEPVFVLSLASSQGAFAGALVAILYARAKREAAAARSRRDQIEFVTGILRHDVANSMTVIQSRAEMIHDEETGRDDEFAAVIIDHSEKVSELTERVKDVVEVMSNEASLQREPVDLEPIVESQIAAFRPGTDDVTIENRADDVTVVADELLAEVVGNLVENALTHGLDDEGTITVGTELDGDRVRLRVADTGDGVPDDRKEAIFERGASSSGGGFGLHFVSAMVDHYGGDVWVEDRQNGRSGAVFVVELDRA